VRRSDEDAVSENPVVERDLIEVEKSP